MLVRKIKKSLTTVFVLLLVVPCFAFVYASLDGHSAVPLKVAHSQGSPRISSIVATIDGHILSVVFLENLGQVNVLVTTTLGGDVQSESTPTPNGVDFYITFAGTYIVYFTLPNGDIYFGEFEVSD